MPPPTCVCDEGNPILEGPASSPRYPPMSPHSSDRPWAEAQGSLVHDDVGFPLNRSLRMRTPPLNPDSSPSGLASTHRAEITTSESSREIANGGASAQLREERGQDEPREESPPASPLAREATEAKPEFPFLSNENAGGVKKVRSLLRMSSYDSPPSGSSPVPIPRNRSVTFKTTPSYREISSLWSRQLELGMEPHPADEVPNPFVRRRSTSRSPQGTPSSDVSRTYVQQGGFGYVQGDEEVYAGDYVLDNAAPTSTPLDQIPQFQAAPREHVCCVVM
eukprot:TRINITY_DN12561_c0_g1_i1.p1 TRINITY_DN12561_c0_g1~~TRINITY_DN12561_c0_g1_i1.p1  ORF type:complete len:278 (-),score=23.58 TRINITY_DN12561_c0_g1_i1:682-1515(-)